MAERLRHRGPDASGFRSFGRCALGHTRLRVLDLSPAGDQPLSNEDGSVWVVFNGEIYNHRQLRRGLEAQGHRFRSQTDTEVVVHLYERHGDELANQLRGMFAFAVWDERAEKLVLARDRLGIKPLYVRDGAPGRFSFASEVRALAEPSDDLEPLALASYLRLGWVSSPTTVLRGIAELAPGHTMVWQDGRTRTRQYWSASASPEGASAPDTGELREALRDSVKRHLVADVPVGVFLSSGVDSVAVASVAADSGPGVEGYTVGFDDGPDELPEAATLARKIGISHTAVRVEGNDVVSALDAIVASMDQPTVDGVNTWVISRAVRQAGVVVALSGLGGDELFSGYSTFRHVPRMARAGEMVRRLPPEIRHAAAKTAGNFVRYRHSRGRRALDAMARGGMVEAYASVRGLFSQPELGELSARFRDVATEQLVSDGSTVGQMELHNYLRCQLLRDTDCMSMAHALEVRVPLLDDRVVECALAASASGHPWLKTDLIAAADPSLSGLAARRKQTFTLPFARWLRGPLRPVALEAISSLGEADLGFDRRLLTDLWVDWENGQVGWRPIWALTVLALWLDQHRRPATHPLSSASTR